MTMAERQLNAFFQFVGHGTHASQLEIRLRPVSHLLESNPSLVDACMVRFQDYFETAPVDNLPGAIATLLLMSNAAPSCRFAIRREIGPYLVEIRDTPRSPFREASERLLDSIEMPTSPADAEAQVIAREAVTLGQTGLLIIGAGFSYDRMPITMELRALLIQELRSQGVEDPVALLASDEASAWAMVGSAWESFQLRFAGWTTRAMPASQHQLAARWAQEGRWRIVSFNWDDLVERAAEDAAGGGTSPDFAKWLWKPHGDVRNPASRWVFPYEDGRVPVNLMEELTSAVPAFALIVGYSERDSVVTRDLIRWLDQNVAHVVRVRPSIEDAGQGRVPEVARIFMDRLGAYARHAAV